MKEYGKNPVAPFRAFGDDSAYKDLLVYAYAIFHRRNVSKAKKIINKLKKIYMIPQNFSIHCRIMFSGDQRRKKGLGHVSIVRVKQLVSQIIDEMNDVPCFLRYAYCKVPKTGKFFLDVIDKEEKKVHFDPKGILSLLSGTCFTPTKDVVQAPGIEQCEIFASKDTTKINFLGKGRRRADRYLSAMAFDDKKSQTKKHLRPHVKNHFLQQVADVYAYVCSHALSKNCEDAFFKEQLDKVKYYTRAECFPDSKFEELGIPKKETT